MAPLRKPLQYQPAALPSPGDGTQSRDDIQMPYLRPVGLYCCFLPRLFLSPHLKSRKVYGQTNKPTLWVLFVCANYWLFRLLIFCTLVLVFCYVLLY